MAFSNNPVEQHMTDTLEAGDKDLFTVDATDASSSHPSEQAEDAPYCSFFLRCLSGCLKSRPNDNGGQLPKDTAEKNSLTVKWLEEHSNSVDLSEQVFLPLEATTKKINHQIYHQPLTSVDPEDSQLNAGPLQQHLNNEIKKSMGLSGNCLSNNEEERKNLLASNGRQSHEETTTLKCNISSSSKGSNIQLEDPSSSNVSNDEVCSKPSLEKWRDTIEQAPSQYFEIDAGLVACRADLQPCKGRTFHLSIDLDKKLYNRPRENVIYENGLICVQTGPPRISETQESDENLSTESEEII